MKALLLALPLLLAACSQGADFTINANSTAEVPRLGLNLGSWNSWGDEQLMSNVLKNPGFEALYDRALVSVASANGEHFSDRHLELARNDDFWRGATLHVLNRDSSDTTVAGNRHSDASYQLASPLPLYAGDVLSIERHSPRPGTMWWPQGNIQASTDTRPDSPGQQALLLGEGATLNYWLDSEAGAGIQLPVEGAWQLRLWLKAARGDGRLHIRFGRQGQSAMLDETVNATTSWQLLTLPFTGKTASREGTLGLNISALGGDILVDDAWLGRESDSGPFRHEVVSLLRILKPGVLRDWQGQLGDSPRNRLASNWARQPVRYRPGDNETLFLYGLPEFIDLARQIGSQPWIVLPTTLNQAEIREMGQWLNRHAAGQTVWVEFGNENWNPLFQSAGLTDIASHVQLASRSFNTLRASAPAVHIKTVANAQFVNPEQARSLADALPQADSLAVGPYFAYEPSASNKLAQWREQAFHDGDDLRQRWQQNMQGTSRHLAAYELNFHSTQGQAPAADVASLVDSPQSAVILGWQLLANLQSGISPQLLYTLAGKHTRRSSDRQNIPLWGIVRNLSRAELRPSGQTLALFNQAWGGQLLENQCQQVCDQVRLAAFGPVTSLRMVLALRSPLTQPVTIRLPDAAPQQYRLLLLDGRSGQSGIQAPQQQSLIRSQNHLLTLPLAGEQLAVLTPVGEKP